MTFFGIGSADGCFVCNQASCYCGSVPSPTPEFDDQGRQVFERVDRYGFLIVVEARPGISGASVGMVVKPPSPIPTPLTTRPDLQIESDHPLGNGSPTVCDNTGPSSQQGGIPGFPIPDFGPTQNVTDALWDFACRFRALLSGTPCTLDGGGNSALVNPAANPTVQFCDIVPSNDAFPLGPSVLTVQVRDTSLKIGPTAQIVVRVVTPTPGS